MRPHVGPPATRSLVLYGLGVVDQGIISLLPTLSQIWLLSSGGAHRLTLLDEEQYVDALLHSLFSWFGR